MTPDGMSLFALPATDLASLVRAGEVSPVELVEAHIRRIERVNPAINAVVAERFERARDEARAAEALLARTRDRSELPPLLGVPCTMKDFFAVAGLPQTGGLVIRKGAVASDDAVVVKRLRAAGAIVLGVTNVPEGGLWLESHNRVYGRTNNPWDLARTAGGSSGGEAAIVAAGGSAFGMGSDIGGSIRIPAAFCGVAGHKPTGRLVPNVGHWPPLRGAHRGFLVCGPITRSAVDLMPLLRIVAGPCEGDDGFVQPRELGDPARVDLRELTVYPVETNGAASSETMRRAVRRAAQALAERGARIEPLESAALQRAFWIWGAMMGEVETESYAMLVSGQARIPLAREVVRLVLGRSAHTAPVLAVVGAEAVLKRLNARAARLVQMGRALQAELEAKLGDRGVLLHPPYSRPALLHREALLRPFDAGYTGLFNVLEFPATTVPTGLDARGLPVGVQVIGRRGNDHVTIAAAIAIEQAFGRLAPVEPRRPSLRERLTSALVS